MKKKILLVEYNSSAIGKIRQILHHKIFEITVAATQEKARDLLGNFRFDLLITETLLPKSHGFILSKYAAENYPDTKIIIISERLKEEDYKHEAITKHGASDFFEKPLKEKEFKKKVLEVLNINEADVQEMEGSSDVTTRIHKIPSLEELEAAKKKSEKEETHGNISNEKKKTPIIEIDLDEQD
jgi:DNA-binding NtrC family response regulator